MLGYRQSEPQAAMFIREATSKDIDLLWIALAIAAHEEDVESARRVPVVACHLTGWRRNCDFGYLATNDVGNFCGAAWARQFSLQENPSFFHDDKTPEVTIGVVPEMQGRGVGRALLEHLITEANVRACSLYLNVRHTNPALRLYQRLGFELVEGAVIGNRVGGKSLCMIYPPRGRK